MRERTLTCSLDRQTYTTNGVCLYMSCVNVYESVREMKRKSLHANIIKVKREREMEVTNADAMKLL